MQPLKSREIVGNCATLLLPINDDESINYARLEAEIGLLISMGVNGIYSNGTAGEFYNQTEDEFDRVSELLATKCEAAGMPFQIGCSHMSPAISLERTKRVVALKPGAIQVILPDWSLPSMQEVVRFLSRLVEKADPVGIVLYNPPHAKKKLAPPDFHLIKSAGVSLTGCKVAGGDSIWFREMQHMAPELSLFIPGHHLATGIHYGAHGAYSNVACINPRVAQQWYETMLADLPQALELERRIQRFMTGHIAPYIQTMEYSNQAADKFLAAIGGWSEIGTRLRWPYKSIPEEDVAAVRKIGQQIIPEFFAAAYSNR